VDVKIKVGFPFACFFYLGDKYSAFKDE